jgi:hypothetical protein
MASHPSSMCNTCPHVYRATSTSLKNRDALLHVGTYILLC